MPWVVAFSWVSSMPALRLWVTAPVAKFAVRLVWLVRIRLAWCLKVGIAARHGPGGRIGRVRREQVGRRGHERGQQVVLPRAAPAQRVVQASVRAEVVLEDRGEHVGGDMVVILAGAVEVAGVDHRRVGDERAGRDPGWCSRAGRWWRRRRRARCSASRAGHRGTAGSASSGRTPATAPRPSGCSRTLSRPATPLSWPTTLRRNAAWSPMPWFQSAVARLCWPLP